MIILIIDDEPGVARMLQPFFQVQGWEFHSARNAQEGLGKVLELRPRVVLLDIAMPDREGWDICAEIRAKADLPQPLILLMSGQRRDSEDVVRGLKAGADDYLPKPLQISLAIEKIKALCRPGRRPPG